MSEIDVEKLRMRLEHSLATKLKHVIEVNSVFVLNFSDETLQEYAERLHDISKESQLYNNFNPINSRNYDAAPVYKYLALSCNVTFPASIFVNTGILDKYIIMFRVLFPSYYMSYVLSCICVSITKALRFRTRNTPETYAEAYTRNNRKLALRLGTKVYQFVREYTTHIRSFVIQKEWIKMMQNISEVLHAISFGTCQYSTHNNLQKKINIFRKERWKTSLLLKIIS